MEKNRELACNIVDIFDDLLCERGIKVPRSDIQEEKERNTDGNGASIYGMEYWGLVQKIEDLLNAEPEENTVIAEKTWSLADISDELKERGYEGTLKEVRYVAKKSRNILINLSLCTDKDWNILKAACDRAGYAKKEE